TGQPDELFFGLACDFFPMFFNLRPLHYVLNGSGFQADSWHVVDCGLQVADCREFGIEVIRELPAAKVGLDSKSKDSGACVYTVIENFWTSKTLHQDGRKRR